MPIKKKSKHTHKYESVWDGLKRLADQGNSLAQKTLELHDKKRNADDKRK